MTVTAVPVLTFASATYSVAEDGGTVTVTVNANSAPSSDLTVNLATAAGTATGGGTDFTAPSSTFMFGMSNTSETVSVTINDDRFLENHETFMLTLQAGTGYTVGTPASTTVTITDEDEATIEVDMSAYTVLEDGGTVGVTVAFTSTPRDANISVNFTLTLADGTATGGAGGTGAGVDYDNASKTVAIGSGVGSTTVPISITDDSVVEADETFTVTLSTSQDRVTVGSQSSTTVTIKDDDVSVAMSGSDGDSDGNAVEGASDTTGYRTVTVTLGRALTGSETVTVPLSVVGATVGSGNDYTFGLEPTSQSGVSLTTTGGTHTAQNPAVVFSAGASSATLRLTPVDNSARTQPYVVIDYGAGSRAPSASGVTLGTPSGGPIGVVLVDNESGDIEVPSSWPLLPSGLSGGDDFRLLFMTSEAGDASSSDIADYDEFVRMVGARGGHQDVLRYIGFFKVFASTRGSGAPSANAAGRGHVGMWQSGSNVWADGSTSAAGAGTPVYWLDGSKVADNYFDFCDSGWDNRWTSGTNHLRHEDGNAGDGSKAWTGMDNDCTLVANPLGHSSQTVWGPGTQAASGGPLNKGQEANTNSNRFYAMSPEFKVEAAPAQPTVKFRLAAYTATEASGSGRSITVTVDASPAPTANLDVSYTIGGTATNGTDYATITSPVTVGTAGSGTITITVTDDMVDDDDETIILALTSGSGYTVGSPSSATVTITDDDTPELTFSSASYSVGEGAGTVTVTVDADIAPSSALTVNLATADGSATAGSDFTAPSATFTFPAGVTSQTVSVAVIDDSVQESDETFTLTLSSGSGYTVGSRSSATVTINDNDGSGVPVVSFGSAVYGGGEVVGSRSVSVTVNVDRAPATDLAVGFAVSGTATAGDDYTALGSSVTIRAGETSAVVVVSIADDSRSEPVETVVLTLTDGADYDVGTGGMATVSIADDDSAGLVLSVASLDIPEGRQVAFKVKLASEPSGIVQVDVSFPSILGIEEKMSLSQRKGGNPRSQKLSFFFVRSQWDVYQTVVVNAHIDDDLDNESAALSLEAFAGGYDGVSGSMPVKVIDTIYPASWTDFAHLAVYKGDETKPIDVTESKGWAHFAVIRARTWTGEGQFPANFEQIPDPWGFRLCFGGTATLHVDYQVRNRFNRPLRLDGNCSHINVKADGTGMDTGQDRAHFYLRVYDDAHEDSGETIEVMLQEPRDTSLFRGGYADLTYVIRNHDLLDPPEPEALIAAESDTVTEGGAARFAVLLSPSPADGDLTPVTVELTGADSYLAAGQPRTITVNVPAAGVATFEVATVDDSNRESDGQITATIVDGTGYDPDSDYPTGTVTVRDDDPDGTAPVVSVTADAASVAEGGTARYTITAVPAPVLPLVVSFTVSQDGNWGAKTGTRTVTIGTSGTATIAVRTTDDARHEPDGTITVTIEDDYDYDRHATARTATVAVTSDDIALPQVSIADAAAAETDRFMRFGITLDKPAAEAVTVSIGLESGTAESGVDYIWLASSARIPAGQTSVVHEVYIFDDSTPEPAETFTARIYRVIGPAEAHPTQHTATGTITDTPTPQQTQPTNTQPEPEPEDTNTQPDTEQTDTEETETVIDTEDTNTQPDTEPADEPQINITAGADIIEGGDATFTLTATPAPAADLDITVEVSQTGDHASTGSRAVTIPAGGSATLTVATTDDNTDETDGTITATINTGAGYTVSTTDGAATIAVTDNDEPEISITAGADIIEGGDATFTLTATPAPAADLDITVEVSQTGDHASTGSRAVTIPAGGSATLTVATTDDNTDETDGTITATINTGAGYTVSTTDGAATVAVADNDDPQTDTETKTETDTETETCALELPADAVTAAEVTGWRDGLTDAAGIKRFNRVLAALGVDSGETPMTAEQAQGVADWLNNTRWDRVARTLAAMEQAQCEDPDTDLDPEQIDNDNNDPAPTDPPPSGPPVVTINDATATEGDPQGLRFAVEIAPAGTQPITLGYGVFDGTAEQGHDFTAPYQQFTLNPGESQLEITLPIIDDNTTEPDETLTLYLYATNGITIPGNFLYATGTIEDND